jgi:hypothetical protein
MGRIRLSRLQLLLLCLALSRWEQPGPFQHSSSSSSRTAPRPFLQAAAAAAQEAVAPAAAHLNGESAVHSKPGNASISAADVAAPATVAVRYREGGQGVGGRWDNFDYRDIRNTNPTGYCPRSCRVVAATVARCQCVTKASLNAYYSGRRMGQMTTSPQCCYLRPPPCGSGGWGGGSGCPPPPPPGPTPPPGPDPVPSPTPSPTQQNTAQFRMYSIGSCSVGALQVVETTLQSFIATLPGVVGSSVSVKASAKVQSLSTASSVVAVSLKKAGRAKNAELQAQTVYNAPKLPSQINVSAMPLAASSHCAGGGGLGAGSHAAH